MSALDLEALRGRVAKRMRHTLLAREPLLNAIEIDALITRIEELEGALMAVRGWDMLYDAFPNALAMQIKATLHPSDGEGHGSVGPSRNQGEGWRPISEVSGKPGVYINVRSVATYRWLAYKPDGARQMKKPGRWQIATEHGWTNADLPEVAEFQPNSPVPAPLPKAPSNG